MSAMKNKKPDTTVNFSIVYKWFVQIVMEAQVAPRLLDSVTIQDWCVNLFKSTMLWPPQTTQLTHINSGLFNWAINSNQSNQTFFKFKFNGTISQPQDSGALHQHRDRTWGGWKIIGRKSPVMAQLLNLTLSPTRPNPNFVSGLLHSHTHMIGRAPNVKQHKD